MQLTTFAVSFNEFYYIKCYIANKHDSIDPGSILNAETNGPVCKFGQLILRCGEKLINESDKYTTCKCEIPPIIICQKTWHELDQKQYHNKVWAINTATCFIENKIEL